MKNVQQVKKFGKLLNSFALTLTDHITYNGEWTVKGFIDLYKNIYLLSNDTKVLSKILELHLYPHLLDFASINGYRIELSEHQNWYPDLTFIDKSNENIKYAVDLKTTYLLEDYPGFCNGFTLGSHGEYFINRNSTKNIQYPYNYYSGHFCLGIIYTRVDINEEFEEKWFSVERLEEIPSAIKNFTFFAVEKWRIASDKRGSGNTANIGSINKIDDILTGNGTFAKAGEEIFDDYWTNYGKIIVTGKDGKQKQLSSFDEYITYRRLSPNILNARAPKRKIARGQNK